MLMLLGFTIWAMAPEGSLLARPTHFFEHLQLYLQTYLSCFTFAFCSNQKIIMERNPSDIVPQDSSLCLGTLPNGLTYYVKSNLKPANTVELRLLVKVGSLVEVSKTR